MKTNEKGFTLVEIIVVILILGILALLAIASYTNSKEKAKQIVDVTNLRHLNTATDVYQYNSKVSRDLLFEGMDDDQDKITYLVSANYIHPDVSPQVSGNQFVWDTTEYIWILLSNQEPSPLLGHPAWDSSMIYDASNTYVSYNGDSYYNLWWADGSSIPGTCEVWQKVTDDWFMYNRYTTGMEVSYGGAIYVARYYSMGVTPGTTDAWNEVTDEYRSNNTYVAGDTVIYNGQTYQAKWYTRGTPPGASNDPWKLVN